MTDIKQKPKKNGRPSKYRDTMLPIIIKEMTEGASKVEVAATLGINPDTLHEWCKPTSDQFNQMFSDTIKEGEMASKAWWLRLGRINLENKEFSSTLWYMNMKNRHNWKDKQEHTGKDDSPLFELKITHE